MNSLLQNSPAMLQRAKKQSLLANVLVLSVVALLILFLSRIFMRIALIDASQKGNLHTVSLLLKAGADSNTNNEGQTPLLMAVEGQHLDVVRLLVAQGADIEEKGAFGNTPLTASVGNNTTAIACFLLDHGANVNAQDASGDTLLMSAAENANYELVQTLLSYHANVDLQDADGQTALLKAVCIDYPVKSADLANTVHTLIDHGANINATDNQEQTALILAQRYKHPSVAKLLEQANRK